MTEEQGQEQKQQDNVVFIGKKPFMNYVTSAMMQFSSDGKNEVIIKARGKNVNRAVDVAILVSKKFSKEQKVVIKDVKIDGEQLENKNNKETTVSTIEITLVKQ
ncbi:MAG: DNA-binding protein Alba [Nanoarchaeota archaeon]